MKISVVLPTPVLLASALLVGACQSTSTPQAAPSAFRDSSFSEAGKLAAAEEKKILLLFDGDWSEKNSRLFTKILPHRDVASLLHEKTIAIRLDVTAVPELTQRYRVRDVPLLVLVEPDGREIDRWLGFENVAHCKHDIAAALDGESTVQRWRAEIDTDDLENRYKLGQLFLRTGNYDDALFEFSTLYHSPDLKDFRVRLPSRNHLIRQLGTISQEHPAARATLLEWRAEHVAQALENPRQTNASRLVLSINRALPDEKHSLTFFHQLPSDSTARSALKRDLFKMLQARNATTEAAALFTTDEAVEAMQMEKYPPLIARGIFYIILPTKAHAGMKRINANILQQRLRYFAVYARERDIPTARRLAQTIIAEDRSGQAVESLEKTIKAARPSDHQLFTASLAIPALKTAFSPQP